MTLVVSTHVDAADELREAVLWYNQGGRGRGRRVKSAYDAALKRILAWPESGAKDIHHDLDVDIRRVKIAQTDFWVVYFIESEVLNVIAVAHERRQPGYWTHRLGRR